VTAEKTHRCLIGLKLLNEKKHHLGNFGHPPKRMKKYTPVFGENLLKNVGNPDLSSKICLFLNQGTRK